MTRPVPKNAVFWVSAAIFLAYCLSRIVGRSLSQLDFLTYYHAAQAAKSGLDAYSTQELSRLAGREILLPFCYPPLVLWFFKPFLAMPYETAKLVFLGMKSLALMGLLTVWKNNFLRETTDYLFYLLCYLGFGSAIYIDMSQGNISIFEQLFLWSAFAFFLRGNLKMFLLLILCGSFFKWVPSVFLILVLLTDHPKRWRYFTASIGAFIGMVFSSYLLAPAYFRAFMHNSFLHSIEDGRSNHSTFLAMKSLFLYISSENHVLAERYWPFLATVLFSCVIVLISWLFIKKTVRFECDVISLACLVYVLLTPPL